ncbi:MAG: AI-2E family transporter [Thermoanaerobaculales bacterium]|jgi:predicted PurR-regulated permease PerM|nr:AI-2E family transporter [Thermoanaerobaculales bacterium]
MAIEFSDRQRATIAAAITILSAVVILFAIGALFWIVGAFFVKFSAVFLPLAVAMVAALVVKPYYELISTRLKLGRVPALLVVFLSFIVPVAALGWFFGDLLVDQVKGLIEAFPKWWAASVEWVRARAPQLVYIYNETAVGQAVGDAVEGQSGAVVDVAQYLGRRMVSAGAGVLSGVATLLGWVVAPIYFAFFLMADTSHTSNLERFLPFLKSETRKDLVYLFEEFLNIIVAFFRGQLIIAFLQGLLFAIGFTLAGLKYGFVIGLTLGFLNIVPYLGNIIGLGTALPLAFFQPGGGLTRVLLVLVVFAAVQMIEGYLLTPKIMGDRTGLHPVVIIIAIFFWGTALNGIMGMILAIPLTAFLVVFWRLAREKYLPELV